MNDFKDYIKHLFLGYLLLFFVLGLYMAYILLMRGDELNKHPQNPRNREVLKKRGTIYSRSGEVLAVSTYKKEDKKKPSATPTPQVTDKEGIEEQNRGEWVRVYPSSSYTEPLMGYMSEIYGKGGVEDVLEPFLRSPRMGKGFVEMLIRHSPLGEKVYLTIDLEIQKEAVKSLEGRKGSIVVLNPKTGEILALACYPGFDPMNITKDWNKYLKDKDAPFLLRPVNGVYPPGSVFKLFTLACCLEERVVDENTSYYCSGDYAMPYELGTYHITESHGSSHGRVDPEDALVYSCNIGFAQMGLKLGSRQFEYYGEKFGFKDNPDFILPLNPPVFPKEKDLPPTQLAQCSFGQGELLFSPLQIALMTSAFANEGKIMKPQLIKCRMNEKGEKVFQLKPEVWKQPISKNTADKVKKMMVQVVKRGTATRTAIENIDVAGKTGSAENPQGDTHAWFTCFAPAENPKYVVTVIVENGGYGGTVASPIARRVLLKALSRGE